MNTRPQSSQLAESLWTDSGIKSGISKRELISTRRRKERKKKAQAGNEWSNVLSKPSQTGKKPPPPLRLHAPRENGRVPVSFQDSDVTLDGREAGGQVGLKWRLRSAAHSHCRLQFPS